MTTRGYALVKAGHLVASAGWFDIAAEEHIAKHGLNAGETVRPVQITTLEPHTGLLDTVTLAIAGAVVAAMDVAWHLRRMFRRRQLQRALREHWRAMGLL